MAQEAARFSDADLDKELATAVRRAAHAESFGPGTDPNASLWLEVVTQERQDRAERDTVWRLSRADVEQLAGRPVTSDEVERVAFAIDNSTANETVSAVVEQVCGLADEEE